jgi:hypothetical protein
VHLGLQMSLSRQSVTLLSVLKARVIVAWGNAPGNAPRKNCGLKARAKSPTRHKLAPPAPFAIRLIPNEPLIELNPILRKHRPHLALEIPPLMMRGLPIDIPHQCHPITQSNRKNCIPLLPTELRELRSLRLNPFGRRHLELLNNLRHRLCPRNKQRNVNVVRNSSNPHASVIGTVEYRSQIRVHLTTDCIVQGRAPLLRTEHQMHQHIRDGLRHASEYSYSAALQPAERQDIAYQEFIA